MGVDGKDPFTSPFKPLSHLKKITAPISGIILKTEFSGDPLEIKETLELTIVPENLPEPDSWCEIPWDDLESKLAS